MSFVVVLSHLHVVSETIPISSTFRTQVLGKARIDLWLDLGIFVSGPESLLRDQTSVTVQLELAQ